MNNIKLDTFLGRTLGKLTPDNTERRNIFWLTIATMGGFGALTLNALTMLTAYLQKSGFNNGQIGTLTASVQIAGIVSGFALMGVANRTQNRIRTATICYFAIVAGIVLLAAASAIPRSLMPPTVLLVTLIIVLSVNTPAMALGGMMNYAVLVRTIHVHLRGRVWGVTYVATGVLTILLSLLASVLLKRWGYPYGYSICFLLAAGFGIMQAMAYGRQAELPDIASPESNKSAVPFVVILDMFKLKEFRMLAYPHILRGLVMGIMVFVVPTQMARFNLPNQYVGYMTAIVSGAGLIGAVLLGLTLDRWGAGVVTLLGDIVTSIAWVALILTPSPISFLGLFLAYNIGDVLEQRAIPLGAIEIVPASIVGGFQSARLMILTGSGAIGSYIGGHLIDIHGPIIIFIVAAALKLGMGLWFLKVFGIRKKERLGAN